MKTSSTRRPKSSYKLTEAQVDQLKALEGRKPDTGDVPSAPKENWTIAVRGKHFAAVQNTVAVHLDDDVLGWLRTKSPDYEAEINRILRERMETESAHPRSA